MINWCHRLNEIMNPHIKILILNWNGIGVLEDCLKSLYNIKYDNFSVCVIDNNSDDQSVDYIESNFKDVEIIKHNYNYGYSKGYNLAFEFFSNQLSTDYYLLLNNDTIISDHNILKVMVYSSKKYGKNNIYSPIITDSNNRIWYGGGKINTVLGYTRHIGINNKSIYGKYKTKKTGYVSGCCMFINKSLIEKLKGFKTIYKMYYEDVDLCLRAKKYDSDCFIIDSSNIIHNYSSSFKGIFKIKKLFLKFKSMNKFIFDNNTISIAIFIFVYHVVMIPIYFLLFLMKTLKKT